jgi:hypothetical protein
VGLELNGTHRLLVCADDVNLQADNIDTIKKSTENLTDATKEVGLEVNTGKTKYMLLSRHQNAGQNHDVKRANTSFENVAQLKYLGTTVRNQNLIQKEIKRRLNSGNACYHSVQNLLSSCLLFKNIKIKIYKILILLIVLHVYETCAQTLREDHRLQVFENSVLKRIFGPRRDEIIGGWSKLFNKELRNLHSSPNITRMIKSRNMRCAGYVECMGEKMNVYRVLVENPEGKRSL